MSRAGAPRRRFASSLRIPLDRPGSRPAIPILRTPTGQGVGCSERAPPPTTGRTHAAHLQRRASGQAEVACSMVGQHGIRLAGWLVVRSCGGFALLAAAAASVVLAAPVGAWMRT